MLKSSSFLLASFLGVSFGGTLFAPQKMVEQGITVTFTYESATELESMEMEADGMPGMGGGMPSHEERRTSKRELVVKETYLAVAEGEATEFLREIESGTWSTRFEMEGMPGMEPLDEEMDGDSALAGKTIHFKKFEDGFRRKLYNESAKDEWPDEDAEESPIQDILAGLPLHTDLRALLSDKEVKPGDSWEVPLGVYAELKQPSGQKADPHMGMAALTGARGSEPERTGEFKVEFKEFKKVKGVRYADFVLTLDLTEAFDLTDQFAEMSAPEDAPEGAMIPEIREASRSVHTKGTGKARWIVEENRWESMELETDIEEEEEMVSVIDFGQGEKEMIHTTIRSGTEALAYTFAQ